MALKRYISFKHNACLLSTCVGTYKLNVHLQGGTKHKDYLLCDTTNKDYLLCGTTNKGYLLCGTTNKGYLLCGTTNNDYLLCGTTNKDCPWLSVFHYFYLNLHTQQLSHNCFLLDASQFIFHLSPIPFNTVMI